MSTMNVLDGRWDQHQRDARREAAANGDRPLPGIKFHISPEAQETPAQAAQRRTQLAAATQTSRMCWR